MTPQAKRRWLLRLAQAARRRLDETIETLEDRRFTDDEASGHEALVWDAYQAIFGEGKTLRWLRFVRGVETATKLFPAAAEATVARHVLNEYAEVFPDLARAMDRAKVSARSPRGAKIATTSRRSGTRCLAGVRARSSPPPVRWRPSGARPRPRLRGRRRRSTARAVGERSTALAAFVSTTAARAGDVHSESRRRAR